MKKKKIIISGLDNAGKTSILTAFDKRYDFEKEIIELEPTIRVNYHNTEFLGKEIYIWDMGGQKMYRELYESKQDVYFSNTDLLIYVIDIQDNARFEASLEYLNKILQYFERTKVKVPLIVAFHKFDPELRDNENFIKFARILTEKLIQLEQLEMLFLQTSIYDILSIVQLISSALSIFDEGYSELKGLFKNYLKYFESKSIILFDQNGVIISEFYTDSFELELYVGLLNAIKEHIILLKKIQEENSKQKGKFFLKPINNHLISYLHRIKIKNQIFYISVLIQEKAKETLLDKFSDFLVELNRILEPMLS
ncbi:MAG: ADP-ribosylation factor-like protein [Promethearchaeota archaeon]